MQEHTQSHFEIIAIASYQGLSKFNRVIGKKQACYFQWTRGN